MHEKHDFFWQEVFNRFNIDIDFNFISLKKESITFLKEMCFDFLLKNIDQSMYVKRKEIIQYKFSFNNRDIFLNLMNSDKDVLIEKYISLFDCLGLAIKNNSQVAIYDTSFMDSDFRERIIRFISNSSIRNYSKSVFVSEMEMSDKLFKYLIDIEAIHYIDNIVSPAKMIEKFLYLN